MKAMDITMQSAAPSVAVIGRMTAVGLLWEQTLVKGGETLVWP